MSSLSDIGIICIVALSEPSRKRLSRDESRARTREAILAAAGQLFDDRGFTATSISDIADAAGYTTGAVYSNFVGKEDLFLAVMERQMTEEVAAIGAALSAEPTVAGRLEVVTRWYASQAGRGRRRTRAVAEIALLARNAEETRARLRAQRHQVHEAMAGLLRQQEVELGFTFRVPVPVLATALLAMLEGFALGSAIGDDVDPAALVAALELVLQPARTRTPDAGG